MKSWFFAFSMGIAVFAAVTAAKALPIPALTGPIVDQAGILSAGAQSQISALLRSVHDSGKAQIQILTLATLDGEPIEQVSIQITDQWQLGDKKIDNGILFLIAKQEHKVRIEVGQGLEGDLPDIYASRIIRDVVSPLFKEGKYDEGVLQGILQIIQKIAPDLLKDLPRTRSSAPTHSKREIPGFLIFIIIFLILSRWGGGRGFGGGFGGFGGGWGGGSSSGGWSGGGGGFSGGGASGDW